MCERQVCGREYGGTSLLVLPFGTIGFDGDLMGFSTWYHRSYPLAHGLNETLRMGNMKGASEDIELTQHFVAQFGILNSIHDY